MSAEIHKLPSKKKRFKAVGENLLLNTHSGIYYAKKSFSRYGIPELFETTGFPEGQKQKAKAKVLELISKHLDRYLGENRDFTSKRKNVVTVGSIIDEFLEKETPGRRTTTQINHLLYLNEIRDELGKFPATTSFIETWENWVPKFKAKKKSRRLEIAKRQGMSNPQIRETFNDYAKTMNAAFTWAYKKKRIPHIIKVPYLDAKRGPTGRVYSDDEIAHLISFMGPELELQYLLCFESMMRLREALLLSKCRFNPATGVITLLPSDVKTGSKTGKGRSFKVSEEIRVKLIQQAAKHPNSPFFFPSPKDPMKPVWSNKTAWRKAKQKAGIMGQARWHDLRHSALTRALLPDENGKVPDVSPAEVSTYAGVSIRTIERVYLHGDAEKTARVANVVKVPRKRT